MHDLLCGSNWIKVTIYSMLRLFSDVMKLLKFTAVCGIQGYVTLKAADKGIQFIARINLPLL